MTELYDEMMRAGFKDGPLDIAYARHLLIKGADALKELAALSGQPPTNQAEAEAEATPSDPLASLSVSVKDNG